MKRIIKLTESDLIHIVKKVIKEQSLKTPEEDDQFLDWVSKSTIKPFIAPNPYSSGDLKLGVQIIGPDGSKPSLMNPEKDFDTAINLIERMDISTPDGKLVHRFETNVDEGLGQSLFNASTFRPTYKIIDNTYVVYATLEQESDDVKKIMSYANNGKGNRFIVTVTPRLSNDLLKTGSKLYTTKPNMLMVS